MSSRFPVYPLTIAFAIFVCIAIIAADTNAAKPLIENDRVRVIRVELPKSGTLPVDNHYEGLTVQLEDGETAVLNPGQLEKMEATPAGTVHYFVTLSRRKIRNSGKSALPFIEVRFLQSQGKYVPLEIPPTHYCNPGSAKACVTEKYLFCTDRFCAESVTLEPGAVSTQHTHSSDHIVIATSNFTWREEATGKPASDHAFKVGDVSYVPAGITHQLTNVGSTTAHLIAVQFK
jgi:quercetin dioxygenase-like cupin family protein